MYNMALLNSGFNIENPVEFTTPLQKLINVGFGLDRDQAVEEIEITIEEEEPEDPSKEEEEIEIKPEDLEVEEIDSGIKDDL